jgi:hypothetical protein
VRKISKFRAWTGRFVVLALAVTIGVVAGAPAAQADTCSYGQCGFLSNESPLWTMITGGTYAVPGGWCWTTNLPEYGADPMSGVCPHTNIMMPAGDPSSFHYLDDTDGFRSDAGCVIRYNVYTPPLPYGAFASSGDRVDDRRGRSTDKWIKISDGEAISIESQSCGAPMTKHYVSTWVDASGYEDQWCGQDGTDPTWGGGARCSADGTLFKNRNYFFCKMSGGEVSGSNGTYNDWWLLTDLDTHNPGHENRSFVSAYYLTGGPNDTQNNVADYWNGSSWVPFPDC